MKNYMVAILLMSSVLALGACSTREMATGAAAGAAGYVIGRETND